MTLTINGERVDQVREFFYLGSLITEDARCHKEIKTRIAMGKEAFTEKKGTVKRRNVQKPQEKNDQNAGMECDTICI